VSGSIPDARALAFEFAGGRVARAEMHADRFLAVPALALFQKAASLVITKRDGTVVRRPWRLQPFPGDFTKRLTG
jgi:hypothetical protein